MVGVDGIEAPVDLGCHRQQALGRGQVEHFGAVQLASGRCGAGAALVAVGAQQLRSVVFAVKRVLQAWGRAAVAGIGLQNALAGTVVQVADGAGVCAAGRGGDAADAAIGAVVQVVLGTADGGGERAAGVIAVDAGAAVCPRGGDALHAAGADLDCGLSTHCCQSWLTAQ